MRVLTENNAEDLDSSGTISLEEWVEALVQIRDSAAVGLEKLVPSRSSLLLKLAQTLGLLQRKYVSHYLRKTSNRQGK